MRDWVESLRPEQRDFLRELGGLALAAGAVSLFIRKSEHGDWGSFALLLVLLVPCALLYGLGLGLGDREMARDSTPAVDRGLLVRSRRVAPDWQAVLVVLAVILVPFVLFQFLDLIGGNTNDSLNATWIFLVTAALAYYAAFATGVSYASLLGSLALVVAWLTFCNKLFDPSASAFRWILLTAAAGLLVAAFQLERVDVRQAPEFATAAGLATLAAAVLGLIGAAVGFVGSSIARAFSPSTAPIGGVRQHPEWDVLLLVLAVFMVWYGSRRNVRGPTYVGGLALAAFIVSVGTELTRIFSGKPPEGSFAGWPLLLFVVAIVALLAGFWARPQAPEPEPTVAPPAV